MLQPGAAESNYTVSTPFGFVTLPAACSIVIPVLLRDVDFRGLPIPLCKCCRKMRSLSHQLSGRLGMRHGNR